MKHHPSCREDHEAIEKHLDDLNPHQYQVIAPEVYAQMSIANRLAGIEDLLGAQFSDEQISNAIRHDEEQLARAVEGERYRGSQ